MQRGSKNLQSSIAKHSYWKVGCSQDDLDFGRAMFSKRNINGQASTKGNSMAGFNAP
jgi:hypothetical protein